MSCLGRSLPLIVFVADFRPGAKAVGNLVVSAQRNPLIVFVVFAGHPMGLRLPMTFMVSSVMLF
jgi:hypothetical protein